MASSWCSGGAAVELWLVARRMEIFIEETVRFVVKFALISEALSLRRPMNSRSFLGRAIFGERDRDLLIILASDL